MKISYFTSKGSVYIETVTADGSSWVRTEPDGTLVPLAGGVHISRNRLQELIDEYPRTLLDKTYCFKIGAEKEFFEDAVREQYDGLFENETEPTVIFFLVKADDRYAIGSSSEVVKIEKEE